MVFGPYIKQRPYRKWSFLILGLSFLLMIFSAPVFVWSAEEAFPFLAEVSADDVNIRAGQSTNFERLGQLKKGDQVIVVGKDFSWYKIQLPPSAKSYVSKEFIQFLSVEAGGVTVDRVNIRAGAGTENTVIGQLTKGEQIEIREILDGWFRIRPVAKTYGWVSDQFLVFKSKDISDYKQLLESRPYIEEEIEFSEQEDAVPIGEAKEAKVEPAPKMKVGKAPKPEKKVPVRNIKEVPGKIQSITGIVEKYTFKNPDEIFYMIVEDEKTVCYVQGADLLLGRFLHHKVTIEGTSAKKLRTSYDQPVIQVVKVRLLL